MSLPLLTDPSETTNIADSEPKILASMLARLQELAEEMVEPMQWTAPFQVRAVCQVLQPSTCSAAAHTEPIYC
jgi:hypothetical protein